MSYTSARGINKEPFAPNIDAGIWEEGVTCVDDVVVTLMLCRSVAELPDPAPLLDPVTRLREKLDQRARDFVYTIHQTDIGEMLGVILYPGSERVKIKGYDRDLELASPVALAAKGLHLLHGQLVFFVHHLASGLTDQHPYVAGDLDEPQNGDIAAVRKHLLSQADAVDEDQAVEIFSVGITDVIGRPVRLRGTWYPNREMTSWEWQGENDYLSGGVFFPLEFAAQLAGFITLLRMAQSQWSWREKGKDRDEN
jgi:hypothetical protein